MKNEAGSQQDKFIKQLKTFRSRLLNVDARNPSVALRRVTKKGAFDFGREEGLASHALDLAVNGDGALLLAAERDLDEETEARHHSLTQLRRFAELRATEKGLDELYLGIYWIEGRLDEFTFIRAPLVLVPAQFTEKEGGRKAGLYLTCSSTQPPELNKALFAAVRKHRGIKISEEELETDVQEVFAKHSKSGPSAVFSELTKLWTAAQLPFPRVLYSSLDAIRDLKKEDIEQLPPRKLEVRWYCAVGVFPQASSALFRDMEAMIDRATAGETDQGIVDNLLDAPADDAQDNPHNYGRVELDHVSDRQLNVVVPSDPSQDQAIVKAQRADCVVIRGPPGTGKSQVIVNLMADALSRGERVLLVCQKRAALDVVHQRLQSVGLSEYAFLVHDGERDRADLYKRIAALTNPSRMVQLRARSTTIEELSREIDGLIAELRTLGDLTWLDVHGTKLAHLYAIAPKGTKPLLKVPQSILAKHLRETDELAELIRRAQPGVERFDITDGPLASRTNWALKTSRDVGQALAVLDRLARHADTPSAIDLRLDDREREHLLRDLDVSIRAEGKWFRFFNLAWYGARRRLRRKTPPDRLSLSAWKAALERGAGLLRDLNSLSGFLDEPWLAARRPDLAEAARVKALVAELRPLLDDQFAAVQAHDVILAHLDPATRTLLAECAKQFPGEKWAERIRGEILLAWLEESEAKHPELRQDLGAKYERARRRLIETLDLKRKLVAEEIAERTRKRAVTPDFPPGTKPHGNSKPETLWSKLNHEVSKKRRLKPIRALMAEYAWPMKQIAPCWLTSPEAASEIFPLERAWFDLVIFDEASQLDVERALPIIYRGKRVVIAGDEQQMPPSHFFESSLSSEDDEDTEEEFEATKVDSLLLAAKRVYGFEYLAWHYRSRYQELIEFSNQAFYDGGLMVAANITRGQSPAIEWLQVKGRWANQTNAVEIQASVDQLKAELSRNRERGFHSIGIITFNAKQMEAIQDAIDARKLGDPEFRELIGSAENPSSGKLEDKLFVKNIENVQGDERDITIFSVGYGYTPDGVFRRSFGPLSKSGGENRLNVAVTRAKLAVKVICSFDPAALAVSESKNLGPVRFQQYLRYAKAVHDSNHSDVAAVLKDLNPDLLVKHEREAKTFDSPLEEQVHDAFERLGYKVDTQVGISGYRIDLAIVDPRDPTRYCLGIECDGAAFHTGRSVRERDVARQKFLESRGWKIARIWSRDWWVNWEREVHRILPLLPVPEIEGGPTITGKSAQ